MMKPYVVDLPTRMSFGVGTFNAVGAEVARFGRRAFVMLDPFLKGSPLEERMDRQLAEAGITASKWYDIVPNPRATSCDAAAAEAVRSGCDVVLAVGGGSTIDAAKAVALVAVHGGESWDYTARAGIECRDPTSPGLPIIAVPTSAGTGAEVTPFAVLSRPDLKLKATIKNLGCAPKVALVDPALHVSKPPRLTASTGIDTFLHAFEGFLSSQSNGWTETVGLRAIQLFAMHIRTACRDGSDLEARAGMAEACYLAGLSLATIGVGIPHSLGQALGALKDAPHGEACAAFLVPTVRWTLPAGTEKLALVATIFDNGLRSQSIVQQAEALPALLEDLQSDIDLTSGAGALGLSPWEVSDLVDVAFANYWRGIERWIRPGDRSNMLELARASL